MTATVLEPPAAVPADPEGSAFVFPVIGFSRTDLRDRLGFTDADLEALDDAAMSRIAQQLANYFVEAQFWEALEVYARRELEPAHARPQALNPLQSAIQHLMEGLRAFRHDQGWLLNLESPTTHQLISLEAEMLALRYLNPAAYAARAQSSLEAAWRQAAADGLLDTDRLAATYCAALAVLKSPMTDRLWAEDDGLHNRHLEDLFSNRDYGAMAFVLWHAQAEALVTQAQSTQSNGHAITLP